MRPLSKIERFLGRFAVPNLAYFLVAGQVAVYVAILTGRLEPETLLLVPRLVMAGQWWRIFAFLLIPPPSSILFIAFAWWIFCLMGGALENLWGTTRFNLFVLLGGALTVGLSFLTPDMPVSNGFLACSVFLAFAHLNPDFELSLFLILPVKVRWLAVLTWVYFGYEFAMGGWSARMQIVAAVGNYLVFFGRDIASTARYRRREMIRSAKRDDAPGKEPRHRCLICGKTDLTSPELDFRYCSKCARDECYCPDHIRNHEHVTAGPEP